MSRTSESPTPPRLSTKRKRISDSVQHGENEELRIYVIKRGLKGFLSSLLDDETRETLLETVREDVRLMSRLHIETSLLVNFYYCTEMERLGGDAFVARYCDRPPRVHELVSFLRSNTLASTTQRNARLFHMPTIEAYMAMRGEDAPLYDCKLRNQFISSFVIRYLALLETNIKVHAFARIKRYFHTTVPAIDKTTVHQACYAQYYERRATRAVPDIDAWFARTGINVQTLERARNGYWRYVPTFYAMRAAIPVGIKPGQNEMEEKPNNDRKRTERVRRTNTFGPRSFNLFPIYGHGRKHVDYDTMALWELVKRKWPHTVPSSWPKMDMETRTSMWHRYFDCPSRFRYSISTDGVSVAVSMNRVVKKAEKTTAKKQTATKKQKTTSTSPSPPSLLAIPRSAGVVAVDPGAREPIVTCRYTAENGYVFERVTAKQVRFENGEVRREKKRRNETRRVDYIVKEAREALERANGGLVVVSPKYNRCLTTYTGFRLKYFAIVQTVYERHKLARLRFEAYIRKQKQMDALAKRMFRPGDTVLYGAGVTFMNTARVRGHRKFAHDEFIARLRRRGDMDVRVVNEAYTTKHCSNCKATTGVDSTLSVSKSPHRYVHCRVCRKGCNRDRNGAKNILLKHTLVITVAPSVVGATPIVRP